MEFARLTKNLKNDFSAFQKIKLAILSDSTLQFLSMAIKGYGYEIGYDFEIYEAPYGQVESELLDSSSELYHLKPDFILIFYSAQKQLEKFNLLDTNEREHFSDHHIERIQELYNAVISHNKTCKILYANYAEISESVFGNYSNKLIFSFEYQLRKLNFDLMNLSQRLSNFYINDLAKLQAYYGSQLFFDSRMYVTADLAYSIDILPAIAKNTADIINAHMGKFKKCLILDLDNTLWGGVIGDDGLEGIEIGNYGIGKAYLGFQHWIKQLKQRGIILAICSQNQEDIAKLPFLNHPEMILKLDDISLFVANWGSKADNIKYIQSILNIDFNSMVFVDDDSYQRNLIKKYLPDVVVPELPQDPSEYVPFLANLNLFEVSTYSEEDKNRNQFYQEEANRTKLKESFSNESDYLESLQMDASILSFNEFTLPRVSQLIQRTNQFNLRTIRYSEEELKNMLDAKEAIPFAFSLKDKYGNHGIVSVIILKVDEAKQVLIDTWLMSCRVLKRGLEDLVLDCIVNLAKIHGYSKLIGEYIPTKKNILVNKHYQKMGFNQDVDQWYLELQDYVPKKHFITLSGWDEYAIS